MVWPSAKPLLLASNLFMALTWNHAVGFAFIGLGAFFILKGPLG